MVFNQFQVADEIFHKRCENCTSNKKRLLEAKSRTQNQDSLTISLKSRTCSVVSRRSNYSDLKKPFLLISLLLSDIIISDSSWKSSNLYIFQYHTRKRARHICPRVKMYSGLLAHIFLNRKRNKIHLRMIIHVFKAQKP